MQQQEFIQGLAGLGPQHRGCVATIGSFDGVHLGHQAILARLRQRGKALGLPTLVMVFEPQPHEFFARASAPARLMRLREKVKALMAAGIDRVLCLKFDRRLRQLSAMAFVTDVLVDKLAIAHLEIGDDFRFGCDRKGDFELLRSCGERFDYTVSEAATLQHEGERISSTRIRGLLEQGQLREAGALLGAPFSISGRVGYGKQLGRQLGAATANVALGRYRSPVSGVFAVEVQRLGARVEEIYPGVCNVGVKPTLDGGSKPVLEVHLLDFVGDLYGECLKVSFSEKLRSEQKFDNLEALRSQIQNDIQNAHQFFIHRNDPK